MINRLDPQMLDQFFLVRTVNRRAALEYMAMTPEQKTWFLLSNPKPYIPADFGPRNVGIKTGPMYEMLVRKWAIQQLAEMTRLKG